MHAHTHTRARRASLSHEEYERVMAAPVAESLRLSHPWQLIIGYHYLRPDVVVSQLAAAGELNGVNLLKQEFCQVSQFSDCRSVHDSWAKFTGEFPSCIQSGSSKVMSKMHEIRVSALSVLQVLLLNPPHSALEAAQGLLAFLCAFVLPAGFRLSLHMSDSDYKPHDKQADVGCVIAGTCSHWAVIVAVMLTYLQTFCSYLFVFGCSLAAVR